jgi:hypothetical protein
MQDKSSYSSSNKPQISEGLQEYINSMVEETVLNGGDFDETKKKWLKQYCKSEGVNSEIIETNLELLILITKNIKQPKKASLREILIIISNQCFITKEMQMKIFKSHGNTVNSQIYNDVLLEYDTIRYKLKKYELTLKENELTLKENKKKIMDNSIKITALQIKIKEEEAKSKNYFELAQMLTHIAATHS